MVNLLSQRRGNLVSSLISGPELARCHPDKPLKSSAKIALIVIADLKTNLRAILLGRQQQLLGPLYPYTCQVIYNRNAHLFFE